MKIALVVIATGQPYWHYATELLQSAWRFMPEHDTFLFTDGSFLFHDDNVFVCPVQYKGFPDATLYRYHTMLSEKERLSKYDYIFYCDADMLFVAPVKEEDILADGLVATQHPGFHVNNKNGTPEMRQESTAYCPVLREYYCGGFNGGTAQAYTAMAAQIANNVDVDRHNKITAVWHDESHLNKYLYHNPPARVLSPSFCYPEAYGGGYGWPSDKYKPVLLALEKGAREW